jgi:hypothetical protein
MRRHSWIVAGAVSVTLTACKPGGQPATHAPAGEAAGGGQASGGPAWAGGLRVEISVRAGGKAFEFVCAGPLAKLDAASSPVRPTVTEAPPHTIISCKEPQTGWELTINMLDPKVGKMDVTNAGKSVITFDAGSTGRPVSTSDNGELNITAWDPPGGHRAATFGLGWYSPSEGYIRGAFAL